MDLYNSSEQMTSESQDKDSNICEIFCGGIARSTKESNFYV